jgi:hypothetical protein
MNALKHGLTADVAVLPNEDPSAFDAEVQQWFDYDRPDDPLHRAALERAATATWKLRRCARVENQLLGHRVRHAADRAYADAHAHAVGLGNRLLYDPLNRCAGTKSDEVTREKLARFHANDPAVLAVELQMTSQGVGWMLERWTELARLLEVEEFWHYPEKFAAIRLLGKRPQDVMEDFAIARIFLACSALHPEPWDLWDECHQARLGCDGKPVYRLRVEGLKTMTPNRAYALELLNRVAKEEIARLTAMARQHLDRQWEADIAGAEVRASFDDTPSGERFRRYEGSCERSYHKAVADLLKVRKERASSPDPEPDLERNEPMAEPAVEAEVAASAPVEPVSESAWESLIGPRKVLPTPSPAVPARERPPAPPG